MTRVDKIKEVRQFKFIQGLPIKEIVRKASLSRNTVRKILRGQQTKFTYQRTQQPQPVTTQIRDKIKAWLTEDLSQKPKYRRTAWRMYEILKYGHGYAGSYGTVAGCVKDLKLKIKIKAREAYIPLFFSKGEAFQFDWGDVVAYIGDKLLTLQLAVVTLCHSRRFYARVYPCQKQELMLDAHRKAFERFGGVPRRGIYDNLKTAVKKLLKGNHRNLQERFAQFCSHYLYEPDFCTPAKGNEKGRVENKIGYIRRNFFVPIARFSSIDELNSRLLSFAEASSRIKKHPESTDRTCYQVWEEEEKESLTHLPPYGFDCSRPQFAIVTPINTAAFDNNKYSVPAEYVGATVLVKGYADEVVISANGKEIARHRRAYTQKQQVLKPHHYLGILARKPGAFRNGLPFKNWSLPSVFGDYRRLLNEKYPDGDRYFAKTLILLKDWPLKKVVDAVGKAISLGVLGDSYVISLLQQENRIESEVEYLSVKVELARYKAKQIPLAHYDRVLRLKEE